jgi:hypothetical protein
MNQKRSEMNILELLKHLILTVSQQAWMMSSRHERTSMERNSVNSKYYTKDMNIFLIIRRIQHEKRPISLQLMDGS